VTSEPSVPEWASARFGDADVARRTGDGLVAALVEANNLAIEAHQTAKHHTLHTYGTARYRGQFERINDVVGGREGTLIKLPGSSTHLTVVGNGILFPFRYATDANQDVRSASVPKPVSNLTRELFRSFGARSAWRQEGLFEDAELRPKVLTRADLADAAIVLVAYSCNADSGLFDVFWGEGALREEGTIAWSGGRPDPLSVPTTQVQRSLHVVKRAKADSIEPFSQKQEPDLEFPRQRPGSVPSSERDLANPEAEGHGRP
jgi:hypothetical protein